MTPGWRLILVLMSGTFYAGAGAALALGRFRRQAEAELDFSALGAAVVFFFASVLVIPAAGFLAIPAFGMVASWLGYVVSAQRLELFRVETGPPEPRPKPVRGAPPPAR